MLAVLAAAGVLAVSASTALAVSPKSPYTDAKGISDNKTGLPGMTLNPGGTGQWLWGTFFDVRAVKNPGTGASDPQAVNIQIVNTNSNDPEADHYNPYGGLIARVRFYESKTSREVLDFDIVLSCAEVWAGKIENQASGTPRVVSGDAYVPGQKGVTATTFTTEAFPAAGYPFVLPTGLTATDIQRGYFSVTAMEALPCEPIVTPVTRDVNTWNRLSANGTGAISTPTNALAAEVIMIRVAAGVSHFYNAEAVSRYVYEGFGGVYSDISLDLPRVANCGQPDGRVGLVACRDQMNFILSKSRVMPQYDIGNDTGGSTRVVFTLPTKRDHCGLNAAKTDYDNNPVPPFYCQGSGGPQGGEQVGCTAYNRIEDFEVVDTPLCPVSPCPDLPPPNVCSLPREVSIVNIEAADAIAALQYNSVSDKIIDTTNIPREHLSGWIDFNLYRDPANKVQSHEQNGMVVDLLGARYSRYEGLPALTLVMQEYLNANLNPVGVYGGSLPAPYEVFYAIGS